MYNFSYLMSAIFSFILKVNVRVFLALALLVLCAYSFMLHSPFKNLDDEFSVVQNVEIRDLSNIPRFFTSTYFKVKQDYYRPMVYVTYALEYRAFGLNYFFYNLDNVFIHIINAFLAFCVLALLLADRPRAFLVSVLFAIHPVHWEAVGNVSGRAILLCAMFVLAAVYFLLRFMRRQRPRDLAVTALCYALALLCKESAGVFILVAAIYWVIARERKVATLSSLWPLAVVTGAYLFFRHLMHSTVPFPWPSVGAMFMGFVTFLRGALTYIRLEVLPVDLYFDRARPIYLSLKEPGFWITLGVYAGLLAVFLRYARQMPKLVLLCILWFWIELLPVSQLVTAIGTYPGAISIAEHFLYLPTLPALVLLVFAAEWLYARARLSVNVSRLVTGGFIVFLYLTLIQQNICAGNEFLVLQEGLKRNPKNPRLEYALASVYVKAGKIDLAVEHFEKAAKLYPCNPNYQIALGKAWMDKGEYLKAVRVYEAMPLRKDINEILDGNKKAAYTLLAVQYEEKRRKAPGDADVLFALGVFYGRLAKNAESYEAFSAAWNTDHVRFDALFNMGVLADLMGDKDKSAAAFTELVHSAPADNAFRRQVENKK